MMQVCDLDGHKSKWKMNGQEVVLDKRPRSSLHKSARKILKERFPTQTILEEVSIKVRRSKTLYLDFYIPMLRIAIEVHGQQHFKYNSLFHSTARDFLNQKRNDRDKMEWCEINGIDLIIFKYDNEDAWSNQL